MIRRLRLIPVLDLLDGVVVRGVAGKRNEYRPVQSRIASLPAPLDVARAFRERFDFHELYVADLDAIQRGRPNWPVYDELIGEGFRLLVDAGVRDASTAERIVKLGAGVILGLESCPGQDFLRMLASQHATDDLIFSLDLKSGAVLAKRDDWGTDDAREIARAAIDTGMRRMIVLDLAQVGIGAGIGTLPLCSALREACPELELITGGGVRDVKDVKQIAETGIVDGLLVASALHDGRLTPDDVRRFDRSQVPNP
jgi:phosphoribosylformimino-5-aminoimidazole carboxamide ribotide isomerase